MLTREVRPLSVAFAPCPAYSQKPSSPLESRLDGCFGQVRVLEHGKAQVSSLTVPQCLASFKGAFEAEKLLPTDNCNHSPHRCIEATVDVVGHVWKEAASCKSAVDIVTAANCEGEDSLRMVSCCRCGTSPYLLGSLPAAAGSGKRVDDLLEWKSCV